MIISKIGYVLAHNITTNKTIQFGTKTFGGKLQGIGDVKLGSK
jgi:hypothetical protein